MSPNIYLEKNNKRYDASLWIEPNGTIKDISKMVHIAQTENFYEQDYYTPSDDGFKIYDTPFGKVGIVKADAKEQLLMCDVNLDESCKLQKEVLYLSTRRKEWYK